MSLFPAFASSSNTNNTSSYENACKDNWLKNSSFQINLLDNAANCSTKEEILKNVDRKPKTAIKIRQKRKLMSSETSTKLSEDYVVDTKKNKEFLTLSTIARPAVPKYRVKYYFPKKFFHKNKFKRYYQCINKFCAKNDTDETINFTNNIDNLEPSQRHVFFTELKQEENLAKTTEEYNIKLTNNVHDIKLWLKYVNFQDTIYLFEKTYRKGSIAKGLRVLAERKLSILDKALTHNPNCEELVRERLSVAISIYPADELQTQLKNLVDKDQGNIILWQGYIEATQCSMSHCNTPTVLNLYIQCLAVLHKLRRNSTTEKAQIEESILKILYQCGLFLKQAGLIEQLWTLLRLYLEINLAPNDKSKFHIGSGFDEKQLIELEEVVFNSQLPLHELWLRIEKLRESCHWLPVTEDIKCEDPQRFVFPSDVAELIHPITIPKNIFKMVAISLSLLKIPLLFCRHSTMQDLGLDYVPWALDSIESLLPIFFPIYPIDLENPNLLLDVKFSVGPQYLKVLPGQEEYLNFILTLMKNCIDSLSDEDKMATCVWWLRFQRLLIILEKQKRLKMPLGFKTKIEQNIKKILKQEDNRNNILYYCEYALIQYELGNHNSCWNILQTASSVSRSRIISVSTMNEEQTARCYLYRTQLEVSLNKKCNPQEYKYTLAQLVGYVLELETPINDITEDLLKQTNLKFKHITTQLLKKEIVKLSVANQFLPCFMTDWFICNGWFLYLTKGVVQYGTFIEDILSVLEEKQRGTIWQKEILYEFYVAVLFKHCTIHPGASTFKILNDVIIRAVEQYPNNIFFLTVLANEHTTSCSTYPWWKLKSLLIKTGRVFPIIFSILIANQHMLTRKQTLIDTFTGEQYAVTNSFKNRMLSLFRRITKPDMCTRRCGLIWRLYLQFIHAHFDPELCRNIYYSAVEECPWLKALYIDAAIYIPAELAQIQDLIIEKHLRLHVTPEELDVLRN